MSAGNSLPSVWPSVGPKVQPEASLARCRCLGGCCMGCACLRPAWGYDHRSAAQLVAHLVGEMQGNADAKEGQHNHSQQIRGLQACRPSIPQLPSHLGCGCKQGLTLHASRGGEDHTGLLQGKGAHCFASRPGPQHVARMLAGTQRCWHPSCRPSCWKQPASRIHHFGRHIVLCYGPRELLVLEPECNARDFRNGQPWIAFDQVV